MVIHIKQVTILHSPAFLIKGMLEITNPSPNIKSPQQKMREKLKKTKTKNEILRTKKGLSTNSFRHDSSGFCLLSN